MRKSAGHYNNQGPVKDRPVDTGVLSCSGIQKGMAEYELLMGESREAGQDQHENLW